MAELRSSPPTDEAKLIFPGVTEELARVRQCRERLERQIRLLVERESDRIASIRSRPSLAAPEAMVQGRHEELERLRGRSHAAVGAAVVRGLDAVAHLRAQVRALSPQQTLDRGYAVVQLADGVPGTPAHPGAVVQDPTIAPAGTALRLRLARGELAARSEGERAAMPHAVTGPENHHEGAIHG